MDFRKSIKPSRGAVVHREHSFGTGFGTFSLNWSYVSELFDYLVMDGFGEVPRLLVNPMITEKVNTLFYEMCLYP